MPAAKLSHPDRLAATLANIAESRERRSVAGCLEPGPGATDCRMQLKIALWRARRAAERAPAARGHLETYAEGDFPELWAGTVQDGVARGFAARLEEVIALAPPDPLQAIAPLPTDGADTTVFVGKQLRRKKDILVAAGGARVRFSRKGGVLFVDREHGVNSENCLWFEGRQDHGTLDGFVGAPDERARLFSAQFLQPQHYVQGPQRSELVLAGRLGRGPVGWPCRVILQADKHEPAVRLQIEVAACVPGWRLRTRFLGVPATLLQHACMPVREVVDNQPGFVADTFVRSCATLLVDGQPVAVPAAADSGRLCHNYLLGKQST